jgi:hypothetical protein
VVYFDLKRRYNKGIKAAVSKSLSPLLYSSIKFSCTIYEVEIYKAEALINNAL